MPHALGPKDTEENGIAKRNLFCCGKTVESVSHRFMVDHASPTTAEQGQVNVPCPPSSNSSQSARPDGANNGCFGNQGMQGMGRGQMNVGGFGFGPHGKMAGFQQGFMNMDES